MLFRSLNNSFLGLHPDDVKSVFNKIDTRKFNETPTEERVKIREITEDESNIFLKDTTTFEDKKNELKEKYSYLDFILTPEENKAVVKRIIQKKNDLYTSSVEDFQITLSYIFDTKVIIENIMDISEMYHVYIPKKYHNHAELKPILQRVLETYELFDIKEPSISEKITEKINNMDLSRIRTNMLDKNIHIQSKLTQILECSVDVIYDEPLYTIKLPKKFICKPLLNFMLLYGIKEEHIIWQDINDVQYAK